jgi:hypothetical protein
MVPTYEYPSTTVSTKEDQFDAICDKFRSKLAHHLNFHLLTVSIQFPNLVVLASIIKVIDLANSILMMKGYQSGQNQFAI